MLDPNALTIGFARRFAATGIALILRDIVVERMMLDEKRPVQFIIAGKAHPSDKWVKISSIRFTMR